MTEEGPAPGPDVAARLTDLGARGLLVWAGSAAEPDLAPFVGSVHLGESYLLCAPPSPPHLLYTSPMEREEAAATGLPLLHPEALGLAELQTQFPGREAALSELLARALAACGLAPGRLAVAGCGPAGLVQAVGRRLEARGWSLVDGRELCLALRKRKRRHELVAARRTAAAACAALRHVAALLAHAEERDGVDRGGELWLAGEPLRVGRLRKEVAQVLARFEVEQPHGNLIAPGEEGAVPHNQGTRERVLRANESLIVDLFPKGLLFADVTRTFCRGRPPATLAAAHHAVREALGRARGRLSAGALAEGLRGFSLQESVCKLLASHGYPTPISHPGTQVGYVHGLGHGVGYELHEQPSFRREAGEEGRLAVGDLITLEPGLYQPAEGWAVRLEDLLYLGEDGPEDLTPLPYDLEPRAWEP